MNGMNTAVLTDVAHRNSPRRYNPRVGVIGTEAELDVVGPLAAGREALSRGEWEQALACFEAASETDHSAEAIEALAMAAWWLDNAQLAIESREHAYRLYRERGDTPLRPHAAEMAQ
jgi:tetratricopeptide (TPR) repeat protein